MSNSLSRIGVVGLCGGIAIHRFVRLGRFKRELDGEALSVRCRENSNSKHKHRAVDAANAYAWDCVEIKLVVISSPRLRLWGQVSCRAWLWLRP